MRHAILPVMQLAAKADSTARCNAQELTREMAKQYATQPVDKLAGLFYLLRRKQLPCYDKHTNEEDP